MGTFNFIFRKNRLQRVAFVLSSFFCLITSVHSQVTVSGANALSNGSYTSLNASFTAVENQNQSGYNITITITADLSGTDATLTTPGAGAWTTLTIIPSGNRIIAGTVNYGMIDFFGSDNITINGLNDGTNSLTISNTNTGTAASTIKFGSDASNNTVTNCNIWSSATGDAATTTATTNVNGAIFISSGTTTGNDNITISNNNIGHTNSNLPSCGIRSYNTVAAAVNNSITISGNNIYNYFHATVGSSGIYISSHNTDWTINNNKFYQTASRTITGSNARHSAIFIVPVALPINNAFTITNNTIGYSANNATGTYTITSAFLVDFIYLNAGKGTGTTSIQNNVFSNIAITSTSTAIIRNNINATLKCVYLVRGNVNIGTTTSNRFGSQTGASISYTTANTALSEVIGVFIDPSASLCTINVSNNQFGGISAANSSSGASNIFAIKAGITANNTTSSIIQNNIIGGTGVNSIQSTSTSVSSCVAGIYCQASPFSITGNTIRNLSAAGGTGTGNTSSVMGIAVTSAIIHTISFNTIYSLKNTHSSAATIVSGIEFTNGASGSIVKRNTIRSLSVANTTGIINGINISNTSAGANFENNMISLGLLEDGTNITLGCNINGINETSTTTVANNIYFNSIQIAGTGITGSLATYAFYSNKGSVAKNVRNNIFYNKRSNSGGTGSHYGIRLLNIISLTIDYNDYQVTGTGGVLGRINSTDYSTLAAWKTATVQDVNSITPFSPLFISDNNLHLQLIGNAVLIAGITISGIPGDIDPNVRMAIPTIGADEINSIGFLPISLFGFNVQCYLDNVLIQWSTASEQNNHYFSIQRSTDGINFENIGTIEGAGNSSTLIEYSFIDSNPGYDLNYYRLKQIDFDGVYSNSSLISSQCEFDKRIEMTLFPNPSSEHISVRATEDLIFLKILNELGSIVLSIDKEELSQHIDISLLPKGIYFVQATTQNGNTITTKLIKM